MAGAWNNLTMREKAGFIKIGVDNGLTSLSDIQSAYNKFAEGGAFGNKQVKKFKDGGEEKKHEAVKATPIRNDIEFVDTDRLQVDKYGNVLNPDTNHYGAVILPDVVVTGYGNGRAYYTDPNDRRLAELIRDENRRKEAYRQIYGTDEGFYMSPFAISDKPLESVSPEFDLLTMGSAGKDLFKLGKNLYKLKKMPVSYTGVPSNYKMSFMEYNPSTDYTYPIPPRYIYTSNELSVPTIHAQENGKIFKIYDKGTGKEFHIKAPEIEYASNPKLKDSPHYGKLQYEWFNVPFDWDATTGKITKLPIERITEDGFVTAGKRNGFTQGHDTDFIMRNLKGYDQLRTDMVNLDYPNFSSPITERIYTTADNIIKAPFEESMPSTALRISGINPYATSANFALGAGNASYDYTKALGGHIYDGETEDTQQIETTKPNIAQKIKLGLANLDNEVLGRALLAGQAVLDPGPQKRSDAKYGLTHSKKDLGEGNDIYYLNGLPQSTYLLPEWERQRMFENAGWHRLPDGSYNLVNKAASKHGRPLPTYQSYPDTIDRNKLFPFGNMITQFSNVQGDYELPDAGDRPSIFYINPEDNKIYVKEEDLNDYSNLGFLGKVLDWVGNPLVVTTGIQPYIYGKPMDVQGLYEYGSPAAYLLDKYMNKQGLHKEKINGKWQFVTPDVVVTPNGYAWGGHLYEDGGKRVIKSIIPSKTPVDPYTGEIFDEYGNRGNFSNSAFENFEVVGNQASSHEFADWLRKQIYLDAQEAQKDPYARNFIDYYYSTHPTSQIINNTTEARLRQKAHQESPTTIVEPSVVLDAHGVPKIGYSIPFTINELYETDPTFYMFPSNEAIINKSKQKKDYYFNQAPTARNLFNALINGMNYMRYKWIDPSGYEIDRNGNIVYMDYPVILGDWKRSYKALNTVGKYTSFNGIFNDIALTPDMLDEIEEQLKYSQKIAERHSRGFGSSAHDILYHISGEPDNPDIDLTFLPFTEEGRFMHPNWAGVAYPPKNSKVTRKSPIRRTIAINGRNPAHKSYKNLAQTIIHEENHLLQDQTQYTGRQLAALEDAYPTDIKPVLTKGSKDVMEKASTNAEVRYYLTKQGYDINKIIEGDFSEIKNIFVREDPDTKKIITIFDDMKAKGWSLSDYMDDYNANIKAQIKQNIVSIEDTNRLIAKALEIVPATITGGIIADQILDNGEENNTIK